MLRRSTVCEFSGIGGDFVDFGLLTLRGGTPVHINVTGPVDEFILRTDGTRRRAVENAAGGPPRASPPLRAARTV